MKIKSIAQYHKLQKLMPKVNLAKTTDLTKLPQRLSMPQADRLVRFRGKVKI